MQHLKFCSATVYTLLTFWDHWFMSMRHGSMVDSEPAAV